MHSFLQRQFYMLMLCISCTFGNAQGWINDVHKATIEATDNIKNNFVLYKTLDSLHKLKFLSPRSNIEIKQRLAGVTIKLQKFNEAAKLAFEGIEIAEKNKFDTALVNFYKIIGATHYYTLKFSESITYFKRSASLAKEKNILYIEVVNYSNIGGIFIDIKQLDSAEIYLKKAITLATDCGTICNTYVLTAYRLLATLYEKQKKYTAALNLYEKGEKEARIWNDTTTICSYLIYYAELLSKINKDQTIAIAKSEESVTLMRQYTGRNDHSFHAALMYLAKKMHNTGRYKEASTLKSEADELRKKMFSQENQEQVNELEAKYKVKELEQEKELAKANAKAQQQQKQNLYIILLSLVLLGVLLFLVIYFNNKKKQALAKAQAQKELVESILATEEKERSRIAKDLHDGIVQDLTAIKFDVKSIVEQVPESFKKSLIEILNNVDAASKEVREISYQMMPVTLKELGLVKAIEELLNRTLPKNNIDFYFDSIGIEERLSEKIEVTIYRICQELLNNTLKHSQAKNVSLLLQLKNNFLQLTYEDDGIGFNTNNIKKGIGINSLSSRIEMVKGSLEFDNNDSTGTTAYIRIPV